MRLQLGNQGPTDPHTAVQQLQLRSDIGGRIDGIAIHHDLKMKMAAGRCPGRANPCDLLALNNRLPNRDTDTGQMVIRGLQAVAMIHDNPVTAAIRAPTGLDDGS